MTFAAKLYEALALERASGPIAKAVEMHKPKKSNNKKGKQ